MLKQKTIPSVKKMLIALLILVLCFAVSSCGKKQQYSDFKEGTTTVEFGDITINIPTAWEKDEENSNDSGVWYHKNQNKVTQSMFYISTGKTKKDFDSTDSENEFFDKYISELSRTEGVDARGMSEPKEMTLDGYKTRYLEYEQDIDHKTYQVKTYLVLKGMTYYNISFGTFVDNQEDFEQAFATLKIK